MANTDYVQAWTEINEELILATETQGREVADTILSAMDAASAEASRLAQDADHQDDSFDPAWCEDAVKAYRRIRPEPADIGEDDEELAADDELLDRLGSAIPGIDPIGTPDVPMTELDAVLISHRLVVEADPIPDLVDVDTAIATIKAGAL